MNDQWKDEIRLELWKALENFSGEIFRIWTRVERQMSEFRSSGPSITKTELSWNRYEIASIILVEGYDSLAERFLPGCKKWFLDR